MYIWRVSWYMIMLILHSGKRDFIFFRNLTTIELPQLRFQTFDNIFLFENLIEQSRAPLH